MKESEGNLGLFSDIPINPTNFTKIENFYQLFSQIHNFMYANDGLSPQEALNEFIKILFIKLQDEKSGAGSFYISEAEAASAKNGRKGPWIKRLDDLFLKAKKDYGALFDKNDSLRLKTATLAFVIEHLQDTKLLNGSQDVKGIAFQKFVFSSQRGDRGQFFTPEAVIRLCVEFLDPKINERVLDPAVGTAGFLIESMHYIMSGSGTKKQKQNYLQNNLFGIEISATLARIAKMRMILEGDADAAITTADSLSNLNALSRTFIAQTPHWPDKDLEGSFDIVMTNPPFGTQGKITNETILKDYSLGYKWSKGQGGAATSTLQKGQVPEILFVERCLSLLKEGGRLAIVLPNGEFENTSLTYVREFIRQNAEILAVISLPQETFIPHGTGVKASVLFARKNTSPSRLAHRIFFGSVNKIGYKGDKNGTVLYKRDKLGNMLVNKNGSYIVDEDISDLLASYKQHQKSFKKIKQDNAFTVEPEALGDRLDPEFYNPAYSEMFSSLKSAKTVKLGDIVDIVRHRSSQLKDKAAQINYIELSDINPVSGEIMSSTPMQVFNAPSRATYEVEAGDVVTAIAGNSVGTHNHTSAIVNPQYAGSICTNGLRVLKPKGVSPEYLLLFLKSDLFLSQMFKLRTGAAIPAVLETDLANVVVPIISDKGQQTIARQIKKSMALRAEADALVEQSFGLFK